MSCAQQRQAMPWQRKVWQKKVWQELGCGSCLVRFAARALCPSMQCPPSLPYSIPVKPSISPP